jgi:hypothetical protein
MDFFVYKGVHDLNIYKKNKAGVKKKIKKASRSRDAFLLGHHPERVIIRQK